MSVSLPRLMARRSLQILIPNPRYKCRRAACESSPRTLPRPPSRKRQPLPAPFRLPAVRRDDQSPHQQSLHSLPSKSPWRRRLLHPSICNRPHSFHREARSQGIPRRRTSRQHPVLCPRHRHRHEARPSFKCSWREQTLPDVLSAEARGAGRAQ